MLVRAARRKSRLSTQIPRSLPVSDLYLPWLCPALGKRQSRWSSEDSNRHGLSFRRRRNSQDACVSAQARRSLATHMTADLKDLDVRWEGNPGLGQPSTPSPSNAPKIEVAGWLGLPAWDQENILMQCDATIMPPKRYRTQDGIGGDVEHMYAVLQGCLTIGRLKRAEAIIKRLHKLDISKWELMDIHEEFVRVSVERIVANPSDSDTQTLHKWFELEIRGKHDFTYALLAYMLKASLQESSEQKRDRLVRRYQDLVPSDLDEKLQMEHGILKRKELELIQDIRANRQIKAASTEIGAQDGQREEKEHGVEGKAILSKPPAAEEPYPEVRATEQKGLGLGALKQSLSLFSEKPAGFDPLNLSHQERVERQIQLESNSVTAAIDRWREENAKLKKMGLSTSIQTKNIGARMWKWQLALETHLKNELERIDAMEESGSKLGDEFDLHSIAVCLRVLPVEHLAALTIICVMSKLSSAGVDSGIPLAGLIVHVGKSVEEEHLAAQIMKATKKDPTLANKSLEKYLIKMLKTGRGIPKSEGHFGSGIPHFRTEEWPTGTHAKIGAFLITALIKTATVPVTRVNPVTEEIMSQMQPAFSHLQQVRYGKKVTVLLTNPALVDQLKREPVHSLLARHLPMISEPAPWTGFKTGGFLAHPVKVLRVKGNDKDQKHYADVAIQRGDLTQMMKGLDVLGQQAWRINRPVLDTMIEAWNTGERIANQPPADPQIPDPIPPPADADPLERRLYHKAAKVVANERGAIHSQRCFQNFQIEIARAYRDEVFYFPHNMDFRGRAYPVPPLFNHMGADHCRGLMKFAETRELGEEGLRWLKIHLSNVFGFDKASLSERERFADDHRAEICDSAINPLSGKRWWLESEDAWQTLATCIELKNAWDLPDPTKFMSSLPVHQDGTCNGLQHYAALGGDEWGARQVNLEPGDRPSDVYTAVAELVKEQIAKDSLAGDRAAQYLDGKINRKIVKQTVMTNVYGVTWMGAKAQIHKQLVAAYKDMPDMNSNSSYTYAGYVATLVFKALQTMFKGAREIQNWLGDSANRISTALTREQVDKLSREYEKTLETVQNFQGSARIPKLDVDGMVQFKSTIVWTTPLGMPVVQPYRVSKSRVVKTCLAAVNLSEPHRSDPVSRRKQLQAFPPNFVHSLDATHMMLSALKCHDLGMNFAAVHDSFWTHASDVNKMNLVLRDAFIRIHSEDVITRLAAEFEARHKGSWQMVAVKGGSSVVQKLHNLRKSKKYKELREEILGSAKESRKVFEATKLDGQVRELLIEKKVAEMLESNDPKVVARAQKIQTPGRIFMEFAAEDDVEKPSELAEMAVGKIPGDESSIPKKSGDSRPNTSNNTLDIEPVETEAEALSEDIASDEDSAADEDSLSSEENAETREANQEDSEDGHFQLWATGRTRSTRSKDTVVTSSYVWVPIKFQAVPKRGNFDVSRLKDSKYFFS